MFFVLFQAVISRVERNPYEDVGLLIILLLLVGWIAGWLMARRYYKEKEKLINCSEKIVMTGRNYHIKVIGANNLIIEELPSNK